MRHRKTVNKLNRTAEHRKALLANLAGSLFEKKRIKTTHAKAKAAQQFVEKLITLAKKDTLHARRLVLSRVRHKSVMQILFKDIAPTYSERNGGYTRVIRLGQRAGDSAEISVLELVGFEEAMKKRAKEKKEKEAKEAKETKETKEVKETKEAVVEEPEVQEEEKPKPKKAKKKVEAKKEEVEKIVEAEDASEEETESTPEEEKPKEEDNKEK